jgi:hypothetical protein
MIARFISLAGVACAVALLVAMVPRPSAAGEAKIDYPHVIVCEFKGIRNFLYLDRIDADGTATYATPSGQFATVSADGTVVRSGQAAEGNCAGKTLEDLRAGGQTLSFKE